MANVIDIIIKANDQTSTTMNKVNTAFKQLTGFSLSAAGGVAAAGVAFQKMYQFVKQSVDETEKYVTTITDMSRFLGLNTEETSRLVQAADDLFISQEKLNTAMLAASRQGIDVSTEGLKDLSEQYLKLNPGVERAQFLMRNFGRSGSDMGKMMEIGADGIDEAMKSISDSMIVTEQSRINIENYKRSVDNLNDSWQGFKYTIGMKVIPELDLLMRVLTKGKDEVEIHEQAVNALELRMSKLAGAAAFGNKAAAVALEELQAEYQALISSTPGVTETIDDLGVKTHAASDYFRSLTTEMMYNVIAAGMDEQAAMNLAIQMGLVNLGTLSMITSLETANEFLKDTQDITNYTVALNNLWTALQNVQTASDIQSQLTGIGLGGGSQTTSANGTQLANGTIVGGSLPSGYTQIGTVSATDLTPVYGPKAAGGPVFGNTPYLVGEQGPEIFVPNGSGNIVPNNMLGGGGSATISQSDMVYLGKIIASEIQKAIG